jgi:hypothetical protein
MSKEDFSRRCKYTQLPFGFPYLWKQSCSDYLTLPLVELQEIWPKLTRQATTSNTSLRLSPSPPQSSPSPLSWYFIVKRASERNDTAGRRAPGLAARARAGSNQIALAYLPHLTRITQWRNPSLQALIASSLLISSIGLSTCMWTEWTGIILRSE